MEITKDMTIGEVVMRYPASAEILIGEGIHCVGCGAAHFESLEEGLMGHGKTIEEINKIIGDMNKSIKGEKIDQNAIVTISKKATEKLKELLKKENKETYGLRIKADGSEYGFDLEEKETKNDEVVKIDGLKFIIDKKELSEIKGARIDFMESIHGSGFSIINPNKKRN